MAGLRVDVWELLEAASSGDCPPHLAKALRDLDKAIELATWPGSTEIAYVTDRSLVLCAIVPADWARAMREIMTDPGAAIAGRLGGQDNRPVNRKPEPVPDPAWPAQRRLRALGR